MEVLYGDAVGVLAGAELAAHEIEVVVESLNAYTSATTDVNGTTSDSTDYLFGSPTGAAASAVDAQRHPTTS